MGFLGLTNRYFDNDMMMSHTLNFFLSGRLHFGIKFYCSDEDESSEVLFYLERSYRYTGTAADTFCRTGTVGWDSTTGIDQPVF